MWICDASEASDARLGVDTPLIRRETPGELLWRIAPAQARREYLIVPSAELGGSPRS